MNKILYIFLAAVSLLFDNTQAMLWDAAQKVYGVGPSVFTGYPLKCLVCLAKKQNGEFFLLLKYIRSTNSDTKKIFDVPETTNQNPLATLHTQLFPDLMKESFVFDSEKISEYKNKISLQSTANSSLHAWWNSRKSAIQKTKNVLGLGTIMQSNNDVKIFLDAYLNTFSQNIKNLFTIDHLAQPMNTLTEIGQTVISNTPSENNNPPIKRGYIERNLRSLLFEQFKVNPRSTQTMALSNDDITRLQNIIENVMMAQICYVCDIAKADSTTALPRALYREVQALGSVLGFGVHSFDPLIRSHFKKFLGLGALGTSLLLYSRSTGVK